MDTARASSAATPIVEERSARREATRQRILDAARVVFAEKGVIGATIEDICDQAGFTRGAVYSNFADKEDILRAVVEREHEVLFEHLQGAFRLVDTELVDVPDLEAALASLVDRILHSIPVAREVSLIQTELEIHAVRRPDLSAAFVAANNEFRARISDALVDGMRRMGREPLVDPADIVDTVVAIAERSVRRAYIEGADADPDELSTTVLPTVLLALSKPIAPG